MKRPMNIRYSFIQILFYASMSCLMGFASVYLLSKDFSNTLIGTTLSVSSILLVFTQMAIAIFSDKHYEIKIQTIVVSILGICVLSSIGLYFIDTQKMIIFTLFVLTTVTLQTVMPLLNSLAFLFEGKGIIINYGLARGLGSAAYALTSLLIGYFTVYFDVSYLPIIYIIIILALLGIVKTYGQSLEVGNMRENNKQDSISIIRFLMKYKHFSFFILGSICVYIAHVFINLL